MKMMRLGVWLLLLSAAAFAQQNALTVQLTFSANGSSAWYPIAGYTSHTLTWSQVGSTTVTGAAVQVDSSATGTGSGTAGGIIASQSATTNGTTSVTGVSSSYARITVTGLTAGSIKVTYSAVNAALSKGGGGGGAITSIATAGIATGGPCTAGTCTITVAGSGNTTTAATANSNLAGASAGDVLIADGSGNVEADVNLADVSGVLTYAGAVDATSLNTANGGGAGQVNINAGTAATLGSGVGLTVPTSVTPYQIVLPGAAGSNATNTFSCTDAIPMVCSWVSSGGGGTTTNALTLNNSNAGAASGATFNGSAAVTLSTNTIGAVNLNATNTFGASGSLNMTAGGPLLTPKAAGATVVAAGQLNFDTTANNQLGWVGGSQSLFVAEATALTANVIPKSGNSNTAVQVASGMTDSGSRISSSEPFNFSTPTNAGSGYLNLGCAGTNGTQCYLIDFVNQNTGQISRITNGYASFNGVINDAFNMGININEGGFGCQSSSWPCIWTQFNGPYKASTDNTVEFQINHANQGAYNSVPLSLLNINVGSNGIDNFATWNLDKGMAWQCLSVACGTVGGQYFNFSPTALNFAGTGQFGGTLLANANGGGTSGSPFGLFIGAPGGSNPVLLTPNVPPANCVSQTTNVIRYLGGNGVDVICPLSSSAPPIDAIAAPMTSIYGLTAGSYALATTAGFIGNGLDINTNGTTVANSGGFWVTSNGGGSTLYAIADQQGSGFGAITNLQLGGWSSISTDLVGGSTSGVNVDTSGNPNLENTVKYHGTSGVSVSGILCTATFTTVAGGVTACTATSDPRLKDFVPARRGLAEILQLQPIDFHWNYFAHSIIPDLPETLQTGFNAENVQSVMPEAVGTEAHCDDKVAAVKGPDGQELSPERCLHSTDYLNLPQGDRPIVAALVNSVHDLQAEIKSLEAEVEKLKAGK